MPTKKKTATKKVRATTKKAHSRCKKKAEKTTTKKAGTKKSTGAALVSADNEQCFWTTDGRVLSNLLDLRDAFEHMASEVFTYHATREKNDFADWVDHVLNDHDLASVLRRSRTPLTARMAVVRQLRHYDV